MRGKAGDHPAVREILVDEVQWTVRAEEQDPAGAPEPQAVITYVWFVSGRVTRVGYAGCPAVEVLRWPEPKLRALVEIAVPALED